MLYVVWPAPPDCVTVLRRQRLCYFKTATLKLHIAQLAVPLLASTKILVFPFFLNTLQSVSILFFFSSHFKSTILQHSLKVNHLVLVLSQSSCLCFDVCLKPEILYW